MLKIFEFIKYFQKKLIFYKNNNKLQKNINKLKKR